MSQSCLCGGPSTLECLKHAGGVVVQLHLVALVERARRDLGNPDEKCKLSRTIVDTDKKDDIA